MTYSQLVAKRDALLKENEKLRLEYEIKYRNSKINDMIASSENHTNERGGKYGQLIHHPDYLTKWKGSFFDLHRPYIENLPAYPLNRLKLFREGNKCNPFADPDSDRKCSLIGYCDIVALSKYGPVIRITDPYDSINFHINKTPFETAINWKGRILIIEALFNYKSKHPTITCVHVLPFTLYEDLRKQA